MPCAQLLISAVTQEFEAYRHELARQLNRPNLKIEVQEGFVPSGTTTLLKLDECVRQSAALVALVGDATGHFPSAQAVDDLLERYPDLADKVPCLKEPLRSAPTTISYTQWECYLAIYHGKKLFLCVPEGAAPRSDGFRPEASQRASQQAHLLRLRAIERYPEIQFASVDRLTIALLRSALSDGLDSGGAADEKLPVVNSSHLPETGTHWVGREKELRDLNEAWHNPNTNVVLVVGPGGVGKTSLVKQWRQSMAERNFEGADQVYDWTFYSGGTGLGPTNNSAGVFFDRALGWFGDPPGHITTSEWERGENLAALVRRRRSLLILDGLEPMQHPPGPYEGRLRDISLRALIVGLAESSHRGLCVITTREPVSELKHLDRPTIVRMDLSALEPRSGAELLRRHGVHGSAQELQQLSQHFGHHAFALVLLASMLRERFGGAIPRPAAFDELGMECEIISGSTEDLARHARRVMASYENWFQQEGDFATLAFLRLLGLFTTSAHWEEMEALLQEPAIPELTESIVGASTCEIQRAFLRLRKAGLINFKARVPGAGECPFDEIAPCHPLVREYFAEWLRKNVPAAWSEAHRRILKYLKRTARNPARTIPEVRAWYQAVTHACHAGLFAVAYHIYFKTIHQSSRGFAHRESRVFGDDIAALASFFASRWDVQKLHLKAPKPKARLLVMASSRLRSVGRLADACQLAYGSFVEHNIVQDWPAACMNLRHLAEMNTQLGRLDEALHFVEIAVSLADRADEWADRQEENIVAATIKGYILHQTGAFTEAERQFDLAQKSYRAWDGRPNCPCLHSVWGYRFCELLLDLNKLDAAADIARAASAPGSRCWDFGLDAHLARLSLGRALLIRNRNDLQTTEGHEAECLLQSALAGLQATGKSEFITAALIALAEFLFEAESWPDAERRLREAESLASYGGMLLLLTDVYLLRARIALRKRNAAQFRSALKQAAELFLEIESRSPGLSPRSPRTNGDAPVGFPSRELGAPLGYGRRRRDFEKMCGVSPHNAAKTAGPPSLA